MISTTGMRATVSWAALVCALAAGSAAWAEQATATPTTSDQTPPPKKKAASASPEEGKSAAVSELVVTGTNIKGVKPIAPIQTITREDIVRSGFADIGDVMRSLPEDFAGGQNPGTFTATGVNNQNLTNGSTVNLFGLGSDATLTLINGHRLPGDSLFQGGDISVIPLGAIERVEVVTDGSSGIYGSDAVAGVVNFILRKDYNGLEVSARVGGATEGGGLEQTYSLLAGIVRDRWHVLVSAEYEHESAITASERNFPSAFGGDQLIEPFVSKSVVVSGGVDITDKISFSVDGIYSERVADQFTGETGIFTFATRTYSPSYNVAATLEFKLPRNWDLSLVGNVAGSSNAETYQEIYAGSLYSGAVTYRNDVNSVEVAANGVAVTLPSGDLRLAVGGGYRHEGYGLANPGSPPSIEDIHPSRGIEYVYGEALIPLVPDSAGRVGLEQMELSASGRYEHYSDLGDTANPKIGLRYVPFDGLNIRGTWGTSFKAPSFTQLYQPSQVYYWPVARLGGTGAGNALETSGGNPHLQPERSRNWTIGADYSPPKLKSMVLSVTYFNINYTGRIVEPLLPNYTAALSNPANAPFVILNPSAAVQQSIIAAGEEFINYVGAPYDASTVLAIAQDAYQNAVSQVDTGVDVTYKQSFAVGFGDIKTFANATWNHLTQQTSKDTPVQTLSGTAFNVPDFRARVGASWSKNGLMATAIINYTSGETNTAVTPNEHVSPLTTVDANVQYRFPDARGIGNGLSIAVSATNLFDHRAPYVAAISYPGVTYDSLNASIVGRFVALQVTKKW